MAFLIAAAPPHLDDANDADYVRDMRDAAHRGIQVFTVAATGMNDLGQVVFRQIAQHTGATNLFVLRGGAGPQSIGGGDPKSSQGCDTLLAAFVADELGLDLGSVRVLSGDTDLCRGPRVPARLSLAGERAVGHKRGIRPRSRWRHVANAPSFGWVEVVDALPARVVEVADCPWPLDGGGVPGAGKDRRRAERPAGVKTDVDRPGGRRRGRST